MGAPPYLCPGSSNPATQQTRALQSPPSALAGTAPFHRHPTLAALARRDGLPRRLLHPERLRAHGASGPGAGLAEPGLCPGRMRASRLGLRGFVGRGLDPPAIVLLRAGPVLQPL